MIRMKYMWAFLPFFVCLAVLIYIHNRSEENNKTCEHRQMISVIKNQDSKYFLSEDGYWINHYVVKGFKVIEPWPGKYSVQVYIPWSSHCVKSGFSSREEAEKWLIEFLKE